MAVTTISVSEIPIATRLTVVATCAARQASSARCVPPALAAGTIWVVAETNADGTLAKSSAEVATLARTLAEAAKASAVGIVVAADPKAAAHELAGYVPRVVAIAEPAADGNAWAQVAAQRVAPILASEAPAAVLTGAGPDGRDVAGTLAALLVSTADPVP